MEQQNSNTYNWASYGRWVIVIICVVFLIFFLISIGYVNRRRNRNGLATLPFTNFYPLSIPPPYSPRLNRQYNTRPSNVSTTPFMTQTYQPPTTPFMTQTYQPPPLSPDTSYTSPPPDDIPPPAYPEAMASVHRPKHDNAVL
ncbi:cell wall organization protein [Schizosaccharomyces cryophilus OY26]|uniref:Cell wall organization protein n=1 Tax=Schizosaccharomyces cryophilus (strain OY26 / ATCC MYA-4695 / CBS 11777 / NBRC 106824 / NRRL Y48691) TaxID=653667 RepID=S9W5K3_SCHCR|nr:cell wall organization protein [Schizosaccharomyces cryophilus OY26]EPY53834.1 cell wall organization protein [Schizosaccharomyces cryophilus OY26]